jgi:serine/threonine protein kinase
LSEDFAAQPAWFRPGSLVAGYRLEAQVGAGGMAVVFRARDEQLGRVVALKILAPVLAADGTFRRRFIAESRAAAAVDDPHIIPVHEAGEAGGVLFIAMRYVSGGDLRRVLEQEGTLPPVRVAEFISPVAAALDAAHAAGLVHRDVKPANILVDARPGRPDHVYLSDFGVSKGAAASVSLTGTGSFLGTPDYSAPEQIQGRAVDGRTDEYALACVAYQLLTGSVPFERDQGMAVLLAHLSEPPPSLKSRRPDLSEAADEVLARALAKAPEKRYGSCGDFADALRQALGLAPYYPRVPAPAPAERTRKAGVPADLAAAMTVDSVPDGSPGAADLPAAAGLPTGTLRTIDESGEAGPPTADVDGSASAADVRTAVPRPPSIPGSGSKVQPTQRPRRLQAIALTAAVLVATAIAVPLLASSPSSQRPLGSQRSPNPQRTPSSQGPVNAIALDYASSIAFSPNGTTLAAGDTDQILLFKLTSPTASTPFVTDPTGNVTSVAFSANGVTLAAADNGNGYVYLWDAATGKLTATLTDPGGNGVTSVAFSPNSAALATANRDGSTYLWNAATGKLTATITAPGSQDVTSVAFSPNSAALATADQDGSTYLWNAATGKLTATLTDPISQGVTSVAFSSNGATLATTDTNGNAYLWDTVTGKLTATLTDPSSEGVNSVAFSSNGATLATTDTNGNAYLWNITRYLSGERSTDGRQS